MARTVGGWWWIVAALLIGCSGGVAEREPASVNGGEAPVDTGRDGSPGETGGSGGDQQQHEEELPPDPVTPPPDVEHGPFTLPALQVGVRAYRIEIAESDLQALYDDVNDEGRACSFTADDVTYPCTFRIRGGSSRKFPKKSWRVELPEDRRYLGRHKLNLVAEFSDRTFMVEKLAFDLMLAMGAPAPRTRYVQLYINGRYEGLYLDIERVDKAFLKSHDFDDRDADIYRCGDQDCEMKLYRASWQGPWEKKTNETAGTKEFEELLELINHTPEPELPRALEGALELHRYIRSMTMDALVSNNVIMDSNDYFIFDKVTRRWTYVPWDLNNSDSRWHPVYPICSGPGCDGGDGWTYWTRENPVFDHPLFAYTVEDGWIDKLYHKRNFGPQYTPAFSNLTTRVARHPELRERVLKEIERALDEVFRPEVLDARLETIHAMIAPYARTDPYLNLSLEGTPDPDGVKKFDQGLEYLKHYIRKRTTFLRQEIARLRAQRPAMVIEQLDPESGIIVLKNRGATPVPLAGMVLTTNVRYALPSICAAYTPNACYVFPTGARELAPGASIALDAGQLGLSLASAGEIALWNGDAVTGIRDLLFYGPPPEGQAYVRKNDGLGTWAYGPTPEPVAAPVGPALP